MRYTVNLTDPHGRYEELIAQPGRFAEIFAEQV